LRRLALPLVLFAGPLPLILAGCHPAYSPDTYASNAAQEEATVQRGVIIGVRQVLISATGTVGAVTGGAAGGVAGAAVSAGPVGTALGAIGGTLVGGVAGTAAAQAVANTKGWEYIVQEDGEKLVSVTQTSKISLPIGLHVLVISDSQQARIVPDYTVAIPAAPAANVPVPVPSPAEVEVQIGPLLPPDSLAAPLQVFSDGPAGSATPAAPGPAVAPVAPATTPAGTAVPGTIGNGNSATAAPSGGPAATPAKVAPGVPIATSPANSAP
jgi:outer membrane lipoprotein SlyB